MKDMENLKNEIENASKKIAKFLNENSISKEIGYLSMLAFCRQVESEKPGIEKYRHVLFAMTPFDEGGYN